MDGAGFVMLLGQIQPQTPAPLKDKDYNVGITLQKTVVSLLFKYCFKEDQEHSFINVEYTTQCIRRSLI